MKRSKLSADIANLLKPLPSEFGEEDYLDDTSAKVLTADSDESDIGEINEKSSIRTQNIDLLDSVDEKYAGKVSNRRNLRDSDSDDEPDEDTADISTYDDEDNDEEASEQDEFGENASSEEESEIEEASDVSDNSEADDVDARNFKHFTDSTSKDESNKGLAVRKQLSIWENLLEMRIKMKKSISASNNLPVGEKFKEVLNNADEEFKNKLAQTKKNVNDILGNMISLQTLLLSKYPGSNKLLSNKNKDKDEDEITSEEESDEEVEVKRRKTDYGTVLSERHELYKKYRNNTIEKWYDKTRIKHTESNSHTIVDQINHILMDKSKLLKKTQLKRSDYNIVGEKDQEEEYNVNIYDDEDFYHQQLKELVEFKSSDITDPLQLSRQWVQLQNMRSKMKRKIDTRATKGRKLKFVVHSKLVNHVACREYDDSKTEDAKKELISSLFQKKVQ